MLIFKNTNYPKRSLRIECLICSRFRSQARTTQWDILFHQIEKFTTKIKNKCPRYLFGFVNTILNLDASSDRIQTTQNKDAPKFYLFDNLIINATTPKNAALRETEESLKYLNINIF